MPTLSSAMQLLTVLWDHQQEETSHSWLRINQSMRQGLMLAVEMGLHFEPDDLRDCHRGFRAGYWVGESLEDFYRRAVCYGNASAWKCYETYCGRKPFIWPGASLSHNYGGGRMGEGLPRLVEGAEFQWYGEAVIVTSFRDGDEPAVIACSYTRTPGEKCPRCPDCYSCGTSGKEKILHRYTITHAAIAEARKILRLQCEASPNVGKPFAAPMEKVQQQLVKDGLPWEKSFKQMQQPEGLKTPGYTVRIVPAKAKKEEVTNA